MTTRRTIRCGVVAAVLAILLSGGWGGAPRAAEDAAAPGETRTWTDITGKFSRDAEFLKLEDGQVHLRLKGGKTTKIPLKELSKKDRDWVRNTGKAKGATEKPVGSRIVLRSYKAIVDDTVFLADALKQEALAGAVPGFFVALTGGKPLDGFDVAKPIVVTIHVDDKGQPAGTVVAVPVLGKERFQKTLETVFPAKMTPKGRSYEIAMLGKAVFAKPGEGYFLLSDDADLVRNAAADPPAPVVISDVSMESFNTAVSEEVRRAGLARFEAMTSMMAIPPTFPEEGRPVAEASMTSARGLVERLTLDSERSGFEMTIDPTSKAVSLAFTIRAKTGTPMAESLAAYGAIRPRFVAAAGDRDLGWVGVSVPTTQWLRGVIEDVLGRSLASAQAAVASAEGRPDKAEAEAALAELEVEIRRLMAVSHFEQEIAFSDDESGSPRLVTRIGFDRAKAFLAAMSKLTSVGGAPGVGTPDADGVLSIPVSANRQAQDPLRAQPIRVAATEDAIIFGFGCADTSPVKAMLSATPAGSSAPPISARVDLTKLGPLLATVDPTVADLAKSVGMSAMLRAEASALVDGIELRVNADAGVLRLLGAMAASQVAAAGAGQGFPPQGGAPAGILPPSIQGFPIPPVTPPGPPQPPAP